MYTNVATPRPATPLWELARKHDLFRAPAEDPFPYLVEGMKLPGATPGQMKKTRLYAEYTKFGWRPKLEPEDSVVLPVLFHKARRSLRV